jgi:hypothetical protein
LRAKHHVHLVIHNPHIAEVVNDLFDGDYPDRRMAYFTGMEDVHAKRATLEHVVKEVIRLDGHA